MKQIFFILLILTLLSCTRTLTVETLATTKTITLERNQVLQEYTAVEATTEGTTVTQTRSCTTPGVCCKCGFTIHMEHECSCGMWRNCPGTQSVTVKPITKTLRHHYKVKLNNEPQELKSPAYQETYTQVVSAGSCK